jgi:hypothetical protein
VTRQLEKDILKVGKNRAEIRDTNPILRQTMNYFCDQVLTFATDRERLANADH